MRCGSPCRPSASRRRTRRLLPRCGRAGRRFRLLAASASVACSPRGLRRLCLLRPALARPGRPSAFRVGAALRPAFLNACVRRASRCRRLASARFGPRRGAAPDGTPPRLPRRRALAQAPAAPQGVLDETCRGAPRTRARAARRREPCPASKRTNLTEQTRCLVQTTANNQSHSGKRNGFNATCRTRAWPSGSGRTSPSEGSGRAPLSVVCS